MRKSAYQVRKRRRALQIIGVGVTMGLLYPLLKNGFGEPYSFISGLIIGLLGSSFIAVFELY